MMQLKQRFFCLIFGIFYMATNLTAQSVNFEETWKEFLENNKISNMSALNKPNKDYDPLNYIKYLLMNTNNSFCQSEIDKSEKMLAAINDIEVRAHQAIPGFVKKLEDIEAKVAAYYSMEKYWQQFIQTKDVDLNELEAIKGVKTSCEKQTLAKYSFMTAYKNFCQGNVAKAKNIIETRTLRLAEKTSLKVENVEGLGPELAKMKLLFQNMDQLDANWKKYVKTGESPGFDTELPFFPCYPIPNMKEWLLRGAADVCEAGPPMLEKVKDLQAKSGVKLDRELTKKIKDLESSIGDNDQRLKVLTDTWNGFIETNELPKGSDRKYGYEYCTKEPLVRAYLMDGFANICGDAEDMLQEIDAIQQTGVDLEDITLEKINELTLFFIESQNYEEDIDELWTAFVAQGDQLYNGYDLADSYCDHVHDVKSWLIKGLSVDCKEGKGYLEQIDEVKETLEFEFTPDVRCRVEKLRLKVWTCQYDVLKKLAIAQTSEDAYEETLKGLIEEYGIGEKPEICEEE